MVERELISTIYSLKDDVLMFPHMASPHANPKKTTVISLPHHGKVKNRHSRLMPPICDG